MGFYFRRRVPLGDGRRTWLNLSKSGVSASLRLGPLTVNTRGRRTLRLGKGIGWRWGR
jgi:hypothetical protein